MAALNASPSGFSYAQAARGHTTTTASQATSGKVTSGTATPATGTFSELGSSSNWADDVEATVNGKPTDSRKTSQEQSKLAQVKDSAVERTKSESRTQHASSSVSSPDLAATPSTATNTDESSSAANGTSSDTTWDTKSQGSEPAWIAERKERQSSAPDEEQLQGKRGNKEPKSSTEEAIPEPSPKAVVLQDAPPPPVNPWAKRMEEAKAKVSQVAVATPIVKPVASAPAAQTENQRPRAESRRKANSVAGVAREADSRAGADAKKLGSSQDKRATSVRNEVQGSKAVTEDMPVAVPRKAAQREHQSLPNLNSVPPSVKDEVSWPTPESAQDKDRKELPADKESKETDESGEGDPSGGNKSHAKTKWKPIAVTPSIVWQTEEMNRPPRSQNGERGGRGGNTARGRGGFRGTNGGSKGGDRGAAKSIPPIDGETNVTGDQRVRHDALERETMPPTSKPARQSNSNGSRAGSSTGEQMPSESRTSRSATFGVIPSGDASATIAGESSFDGQRTNSPTKLDSTVPDELKIPEPIPRQGFTVVSTDDSRNGIEPTRDGAPVRRVPSDNKKESRSFEGFGGKEWNSAPRGGKRSGRGRGGSREYINGHQSSQVITNGHADPAINGYGVPPSPSTYQSSRPQFGFGQQARGGWPRINSRSQSIPVENGYGGRPPWPSQQPTTMQTYYPGMYDYNGMPMSAMPYHPMVDHQYLMEMVTTQLEYYFSIDNLLKDMFLRKNMDSQGFVFLDVIANFNRIKQLTNDKELLKACSMRSDHIDIRVGEDGKERLRRHEGWDQFLLPKEQREPGAQNDGAAVLRRPERPQLQFFPNPQMVFRGPASAGLPRRSYDPGYLMNGAVPQFSPISAVAEGSYSELPNGEEGRGRAAKSPIRENSVSPSQAVVADFVDPKDLDVDVFPNEHQNTLTVVVKMNQSRSSHHHAASRTFSNGSIDTRTIFGEMERPVENHDPASANGDTPANGDVAHTSSSRHASPGVDRSPDKSNSGSEIMLLWVKDKEVPQESLPHDATLEPYQTLRDKALGQRQEAATGTCPYDLDVLYQFWSHFLIRNFNKNMYGEFKFHAHDDAQNRHSGVGLQNLVQFYAKALASTNPIRDSIVKDYVELVKSEPTILQGLARKQLRQAWRNGALNLKNRKKLADILDETLKLQLES